MQKNLDGLRVCGHNNNSCDTSVQGFGGCNVNLSQKPAEWGATFYDEIQTIHTFIGSLLQLLKVDGLLNDVQNCVGQLRE